MEVSSSAAAGGWSGGEVTSRVAVGGTHCPGRCSRPSLTLANL